MIHITLGVAEECIQKKAVVYDGDEDAHYDTISAFIKSMRGRDPDATLYWLAKMIHAGEDPRFIARRIIIHAAEDVGLARKEGIVGSHCCPRSEGPCEVSSQVGPENAAAPQTAHVLGGFARTPGGGGERS